jgi:hypothetical protein
LPFASAYAGQDDSVLSEPGGWNAIESVYFTIYYRPGADLRTIAKRLTRRRLRLVSNKFPDDINIPPEKIAYRMDILLKKVEEILGMHPRRFHATVIIFRDSERLSDEYFRIFAAEADLRSFYVYKNETIYTTEKAISDSVMAHEMAHAVVDNYFAVRPPDAIKEILSCHVDEQLDR